MLKKLICIFLPAMLILSNCVPKATAVVPFPESTPTADLTAIPHENPQIVLPTLQPGTETSPGFVQVPSQVDEMVAALENLSLNKFYERSFIFWLSRDPERITLLGVSSLFGNRNNQLTNLSESYIQDSEKLERSILELLQSYNRSMMQPEEQLDFDAYLWFWQDRVNAQPFRYNSFPVQSYAATSVPDQLIDLFINHHPLNSRTDFDDYIMRINLIQKKIEQCIRQMQIREELGLVPGRMLLSSALQRLNSYLPMEDAGAVWIEETILYTHFSQVIENTPYLSQSEKLDYLNRAKSGLQDSFVPAYRDLAIYLGDLLERTDAAVGVWSHPSGAEYYRYLTQHYTSTILTPEQIKAFAESNIAATTKRLYEVAAGMSINTKGMSVQNLMQEKEGNGQSIQIYKQIPSLIHEQLLTSSFNQNLDAMKDLITINPDLASFTTEFETILGYKPGSNYVIADPWIELSAGLSTRSKTIDKSIIFLSTVMESVSNRLKRVDSGLYRKTPLFRNHLSFSGYNERWQGYILDTVTNSVEYANTWDEFTKIQRDLFLYSCLAVDIGIHVNGWTIGESIEYINEVNGYSPGTAQPVVERIAQNPGQILIYTIGQDQMRNLMKSVDAELDETYSVKDFNDWMVAKGNLPFPLMEAQAKEYISIVKTAADPSISWQD